MSKVDYPKPAAALFKPKGVGARQYPDAAWCIAMAKLEAASEGDPTIGAGLHLAAPAEAAPVSPDVYANPRAETAPANAIEQMAQAVGKRDRKQYMRLYMQKYRAKAKEANDG